MNIFITGDTHGDLSNVLEMYHALTSEKELPGIPHVDSFNCLIHTGDYKKDAFELGKRLGLEVYSAFGNCDDYWSPDFDVLDTDAGSIVVTHGHIEDVNSTHDRLYELAEDQGCNVIVYGHTHIPVFTEENGYIVINPGSPSRPLDGTLGSCAILTADENGYKGEIVYYSDVKAAIYGEPAEDAAAEDTAAPAEEEPAPKEPAEADEAPEEPAEAPAEEEQPQAPEEPTPAPAAPAEKPKKKSGFGGFLRKIFNYSDGQ